ncbi:hypothetical protein E2562_004752 [Oryza meyeriana var. granulata]|uniref:Uncharacterized protein n=1 Tax=Oryza meyeriana var. granulata TaxID=110450 RepID=A0A6G1DF29_9ORYZ|nr:hypothetical protein E2562_004752 [Oryza meyeriana var. granulata]
MANPKPDDPLLNPPAPASNHGNNVGRRVPWPSLIGFLGLAVNFALCIHRAEGDRGTVADVTFAYLNLLLLFWCIRQFDQAPHGSAARGRIRVAVWLLATSLTAVFTWKVAALMPLPVAVMAWVMAAATVIGGFYGFFIHEDK